MSSLGSLGEFGLIRSMTQGVSVGDNMLVGIGDDCAVVQLGNMQVLLSCDAMVEDVHFRRAWAEPEQIGGKAAAAAISDIAAMGGIARFLLATLACPSDISPDYVRRLFQGIHGRALACGAQVVGGDTVASRHGVMIDIAVVGEVSAGGRALCRNGVQPGDVIVVSGYPGMACLGLHALEQGRADLGLVIEAHLRPEPRLALGQALARHSGVHAMIDVSDGVAQDVGHLAEKSGVRIDLQRSFLPATDVMRDAAARLGVSLEACILSGGEDYELAAAVAAGEADALCAQLQLEFGLPLTCIGKAETGAATVSVDGAPLQDSGFDHFCARK